MATVLKIDLALPEPAYEQIVRGLRALLVGGELAPGEQLPAVRQLAVDLGLNHNTVAEAYRLLAKEGWLDLRHGRGATVVARQSPRPSRASKSQFARQLQELIAKAISDGVPRAVIAEGLTGIAAEITKGELS
jgi:DNA-binding transcriptional regulator YhcF (GntR family)